MYHWGNGALGNQMIESIQVFYQSNSSLSKLSDIKNFNY